jgi:hypothetical protein
MTRVLTPTALILLCALVLPHPARAAEVDLLTGLSQTFDQAGEALLQTKDSAKARRTLAKVRSFLLKQSGIDYGLDTLEEKTPPHELPVRLVLAADDDLLAGRGEAARDKIHKLRVHLSRAIVVTLSDSERRAADDGALSDSLSFSPDPSSFALTWLKKAKILDKDFRRQNASLRKTYPNLSAEQLADMLIKESSLKSGAIGAVAAVPGSLPLAGTLVRVGALVPEFYFVFREQARLIFRIADLYGAELDSDEKAMELLLILGASGGVGNFASAAESYLEMRATRALARPEVVAKLGRVLARIGARYVLNPKLLASAGAKLVPVIGIGTSFAINYVMTRGLGRTAKWFYSSRQRTEAADRRQALALPRLRTAALRAVLTAAAPEGVSAAEREIVRGLARETVLVPEDGELVDAEIAKAEAADDSLIDALADRRQHIREHVLRRALRAQYSDLKRSDAEQAAFHALAKRLGLSPETPEGRRRLEELEAAEIRIARGEQGEKESIFTRAARGASNLLSGVFAPAEPTQRGRVTARSYVFADANQRDSRLVLPVGVRVEILGREGKLLRVTIPAVKGYVVPQLVTTANRPGQRIRLKGAFLTLRQEPDAEAHVILGLLQGSNLRAIGHPRQNAGYVHVQVEAHEGFLLASHVKSDAPGHSAP